MTSTAESFPFACRRESCEAKIGMERTIRSDPGGLYCSEDCYAQDMSDLSEAAMPDAPEVPEPGLESRYIVHRRRGLVDGQEVLEEVQDQCFILRPDTDIAARVALRAYAEHMNTVPSLRADIHAWIDRVIDEKPLR